MTSPSPHIPQSAPALHTWSGLILIGGGGHALVIAEAAALAGFPIAGCFDDRTDLRPTTGGPALPRLASLNEGLARLGAAPSNPATAAILAIGTLATRRNLIPKLPRGVALATIVHPGSFVSPTCTIGRGVYVGPRAVIHSAARIADHAIINTGAIVEHECRIGENAHIAPGAVLGGNVTIGPDTLIGLGARVLPGISIGPGCTIGAGATVIRDVEEGETVVGVPARPVPLAACPPVR